MTKAFWWAWLGLGAFLVPTACLDDPMSDELKPSGGDEPVNVAGDGVGEDGEDSAGGLGGYGGQAGAGGAGAAQRVREAAERGLGAQDVELDSAALIGRSFTLASSLCVGEGDGGEGNIGGGPGGGDPLPMFHVREAEKGGLEAVTYTEDGGLPLVEVTPMRQVGLGWALKDVATCASLNYEFEESWETARYHASALHVVFVKGAAPKDLTAVVAASAGARVLVSKAELDEQAPTMHRLDLEGHYEFDLVRNTGFTQHFIFSEPMLAETEIVIEDAQGSSVEIEPRLQQGYLVGFDVSDVLSTGFEIAGMLEDLAGNALATPVPYRGIQLAAVAGDFEQEASFIDETHWDSDSVTPCSTGTLTTLEDLGIPALAGTHSFVTGSEYSYCPSWLRLEAPPGSTKVVFDARLVGSAPATAFSAIRVCASSLGVGGDDVCGTVDAGWTEDPDYAAPKPVVSEVRTLTFPLPPNATDVLVEIDSGNQQRLWIDSLHTQ